MDQAIQLITQFGSKLTELATQVGPEVFALAMAAIVVHHVGQLLIGASFALAAYVAFRITRSLARNFDIHDDMAPPKGIGAALSGLATLIFVLVAADHLFDIWNWAALYDPRLVVAKRVLGL